MSFKQLLVWLNVQNNEQNDLVSMESNKITTCVVCFRLGKTIQVIAFLSGMFDMQKIQSVLIVLPVALMVNWEKEFSKW